MIKNLLYFYSLGCYRTFMSGSCIALACWLGFPASAGAVAITLTPSSCVPAPACSNGAEILNTGGTATTHTFPPISFTFTLPQPVPNSAIFEVTASGDLNNTADIVKVLVGATNVGILDFPAFPAQLAGNCNQFNRNNEAPAGNLVCTRPEKVGPGGDLVDPADPNKLVSASASLLIDKNLLTGATIVLSLVPNPTALDIAFQAKTLTFIPEPSTWLLFASGLGALLLWRTKRNVSGQK